eukprot:9502362-Pyramimonas_sp.AAC.1
MRTAMMTTPAPLRVTTSSTWTRSKGRVVFKGSRAWGCKGTQRVFLIVDSRVPGITPRCGREGDDTQWLYHRGRRVLGAPLVH